MVKRLIFPPKNVIEMTMEPVGIGFLRVFLVQEILVRLHSVENITSSRICSIEISNLVPSKDCRFRDTCSATYVVYCSVSLLCLLELR